MAKVWDFGATKIKIALRWGWWCIRIFSKCFFAAARGSGAGGMRDEDADLAGRVELGLVNGLDDLAVL